MRCGPFEEDLEPIGIWRGCVLVGVIVGVCAWVYISDAWHRWRERR